MHKTLKLRVIAIALLLLTLAAVARADSDTLIVQGAITSGGGALSAGGYSLAGAIGQPLAGTLQAGEYRLTSGTVPPGLVPQPAPDAQVYLPLVRH